MLEQTHPRVLIVDDEISICRSCDKILSRKGFDVVTAPSGRRALEVLRSEPVDIVLTDLKMVDMGGMELLENLAVHFPGVVPVVITGYASIASVVETMKLGAHDYLPKPFTAEELIALVNKAWERRKKILEHRAAAEGRDLPGFCGLVGRSGAMQELYASIAKVAPTTSTVLIVGESGTGKELVARALHALSARSSRRFTAVDCGTLSVSLLESELFGHVKGAFTGAVSAKPGIMEVSDGGTVFLDEIGNIGLEIQGKLLRFIEEREFIPVGGTGPTRVDVRLIFATNRDLTTMVAEGSFREDLYYRLCVYPIYLPPLRERRGDIPLLASHLLRKIAHQVGEEVPILTEPTLNLLERHHWPGNIRELENALERALITCEGDTLEPRHLPVAVTGGTMESGGSAPRTGEELVQAKKRLRERAVEAVERDFVLQALVRNGWNVSKAAREVGMRRQNFQALMKKRGITREKGVGGA